MKREDTRESEKQEGAGRNNAKQGQVTLMLQPNYVELS